MQSWNTLTKKIFFVVSQTRSQSLRCKENSAIMGFFFIAEKSSNTVFVYMPQSKTEVKMTFLEAAIL